MIKKGFYLLFVLSGIFCLFWVLFRINMNHRFEEEVNGYLQNYVEAGTVEIALENIDRAIEALEERGMTEGNTDVLFWHSPNNDIGLWYRNLVDSREKLEKNQEYDLLEKQRNGLKGGVKGTEVMKPNEIELFPYNKVFLFGEVLAFASLVMFGFICVRIHDK